MRQGYAKCFHIADHLGFALKIHKIKKFVSSKKFNIDSLIDDNVN